MPLLPFFFPRGPWAVYAAAARQRPSEAQPGLVKQIVFVRAFDPLAELRKLGPQPRRDLVPEGVAPAPNIGPGPHPPTHPPTHAHQERRHGGGGAARDGGSLEGEGAERGAPREAVGHRRPRRRVEPVVAAEPPPPPPPIPPRPRRRAKTGFSCQDAPRPPAAVRRTAAQQEVGADSRLPTPSAAKEVLRGMGAGMHKRGR